MAEPAYLKMPSWSLTALSHIYHALTDPREAEVLAALDTRMFAQESDEPWYAHFAPSVREKRPPTPDGESRILVNPDDVCAHFQAGGTLSQLMPGYLPRQGQIDMAREVTHSLNRKAHLFAEAGTGVGKSLAYLVPAAIWSYRNSVPIIISTNTRNLQTQLISKDMPTVRHIMEHELKENSPFRAVVLKGRSNYLCLKTFGQLLDGEFESLEPEALATFAATIEWSTHTRDGDLDSLSSTLKRYDTALLHQLGCSGDDCSGRACPHYRRCFLQKARQRAMDAHLVIANHSLVLSEVQNPGSVLPVYGHIIFDEAHNLEEAATRHLSSELSPYVLYRLCQRIVAAKGRVGRGLVEQVRKQAVDGSMVEHESLRDDTIVVLADLQNLVSTLSADGTALFALLATFITRTPTETIRYRSVPDPDFPIVKDVPPILMREVAFTNSFISAENVLPKTQLDESTQKVCEDLMALLKALERLYNNLNSVATEEDGLTNPHEDLMASVQNLTGQFKGFGTLLTSVLTGADPNFVYWMERWHGSTREVYAQLNAAPLVIAKQMNELFYCAKESVILSSATLRVRQDFSYIEHRLGADLEMKGHEVRRFVAQSPFDYQRQCAICVPTFLPDPPSGGTLRFDDPYVLELSRMMFRLFVAAKGRSLALFTSYEMMIRAAEYLEKPLADRGVTLLMQSSQTSRDAITATFRENKGACVLFGAQSFWEGVDIVGEALSCIVVARLPFGAIHDPLFEARCEEIVKQGGQPFRELNLPQAVIRLRQGFGRLIRSQSDRGIVVIADSRVIKKGYGSTMLSALPAPVRRIDTWQELISTFHQIMG